MGRRERRETRGAWLEEEVEKAVRNLGQKVTRPKWKSLWTEAQR